MNKAWPNGQVAMPVPECFGGREERSGGNTSFGHFRKVVRSSELGFRVEYLLDGTSHWCKSRR